MCRRVVQANGNSSRIKQGSGNLAWDVKHSRYALQGVQANVTNLPTRLDGSSWILRFQGYGSFCRSALIGTARRYENFHLPQRSLRFRVRLVMRGQAVEGGAVAPAQITFRLCLKICLDYLY